MAAALKFGPIKPCAAQIKEHTERSSPASISAPGEPQNPAAPGLTADRLMGSADGAGATLLLRLQHGNPFVLMLTVCSPHCTGSTVELPSADFSGFSSNSMMHHIATNLAAQCVLRSPAQDAVSKEQSTAVLRDTHVPEHR